MSPEVAQFLNRDDSDLIAAIARELEAHVASIAGGVSGYAVLTGDDTSVTHLMAAYAVAGTTIDQSFFDVHAWEMCPGTFNDSVEILERLNAEFDRLYPVDPMQWETDEVQDAHVAKLHDTVLSGMQSAKLSAQALRAPSVFCVFTIPDSEHDIDLKSSQALNSPDIHTQFTRWRC